MRCTSVVRCTYAPVITELVDLEANEDLNRTLNSMQMPKVEYKEIYIEDYSRYPCICFYAQILLFAFL